MSLAKFLDGTATADPEVTQAILDLKAELDALTDLVATGGATKITVVPFSELTAFLTAAGYTGPVAFDLGA